MDKDLSGARSSITFMADDYKRTCRRNSLTEESLTAEMSIWIERHRTGVQLFKETGKVMMR
jgi:hypothetical protein